MNKKEIWKDIKGYKGYYQVSNLGRVKSLDRYSIDRRGGKHFLKGIILTPYLCKGYLRICLHVNGKQKQLAVHRLVAEAFIPNPNNYPQINHKDENKTNNTVDNLEWCTAKYNNNYGTRLERIKAANIREGYKKMVKTREEKNIGRKQVRCITTGKVFNSLKEAGEYYHCNLVKHMSAIKKGIRKHCGKLSNGTPLEWEYLN